MQKKISELTLTETVGLQDVIVLNQQFETKQATISTLKNAFKDAEHSVFIAKGVTNGNEQKRLYLDDTKMLIIPDNSLWTFDVKISAISISENNIDSDSEEGEFLKTTLGAWWIFRGGILVQSVEGSNFDFSKQARMLPGLITESGCDPALMGVAANVSAYEGSPYSEPNALDVTVSGIEGKVIDWVAIINVSQVSQNPA